MLKSDTNLYAGLIAAAAGGILAVPFGLGVGLIPLLVFAAGDAIASLFIPSAGFFRAGVDKKHARRRRERIRRHLLDEVKTRGLDRTRRMIVYRKICDRIGSLRKLSRNRKTVIEAADIDRLENASVDYLGMWLAYDALKDREAQIDEEGIKRKIDELEQRIADAQSANRQRLQKARNDLNELLKTARRVGARKVALEAALLTLPDSIEELYHTMVTNPVSNDAAEKLREAVSQLRIEQDIDLVLEDELENIEPIRRELGERRAAARARGKAMRAEQAGQRNG